MSKNPLYRYTLNCNAIGYDELLGVGNNSGEVRMNLADGYALLWDTGQDFSKFQLPSGISNKGTRRYRVVIYDADRVITGYLDQMSAGLNTGSNVVANYDFTSNYIDAYGVGALTNWTRNSAYVGYYDDEGTAVAAFSRINYDIQLYQTISVLPFTQYYVNIRLRDSGGDGPLYIALDDVDYIYIPHTTIPHLPGGYATLSYVIQTGSNTSPVLKLHTGLAVNSQFYVDWLSIAPITDVATYRGVKIFNAQVGGSQNICGGHSTVPSGWRHNRIDYQYKIIPEF